MPSEIEAKARVADLETVREALRRERAQLAESGYERNIVFDTPDGRLRASDSLLRLRLYGKAIVTFKGPRVSKGHPVKTRDELEVEVGDFGTAARIFEALGYEVVWVYEKHREKWLLGDAKVLLDRLPHIGTFVEVEGRDEAEVMGTLGRLGVPAEAVTSKTYLELFVEHSKETGRALTDMVFGEGEGRPA